jgi:lysophospholipase L1-like esterase
MIPFTDGHRRRALTVLAVSALCPFAASCGGTAAPHQQRAATPHVRVVALGDSETSGNGDPTGAGWVGRYADLLRKRRGLEVDVANLAVEGKTSADLLADVRSDPRTRTAVKGAQVVLFGIGGADLNDGDDAFEAGQCRAERCYEPVLDSFAHNFDATVAEVRKLRGSKETVLRATTMPNALTGAEDVIPPFLRPVSTRIGTYQAKTANRAICRTMSNYDGQCIDVLRAFNGRAGAKNAYDTGLLNHEDCCYASGKGQQLMAELLLDTGLAPVR